MHCDSRVAEVATQPLQFLAFIRPHRHTSMQRKPGNIAHLIAEERIAGRLRSQRKYLAPLMWSHGDAVGDGMPQQGIHPIFDHCIRGQIDILRIPPQESLPFEESAHVVRDPMGQFGEFGTARRSDPTKQG